MKAIVILGIAVSVLFAACAKDQRVNIKGKVLDIETGIPLSGITVAAESSSMENKGVVAKALSDGNGEYLIENYTIPHDDKFFQPAKSGDLSLWAYATYYEPAINRDLTLGRKAADIETNLSVRCLSIGNFNISVNASISWTYGVVKYYRCNTATGQCVEYVGSSANGLFGFYPTSQQTFTEKIPAGNTYKNVFITYLYNGSNIIKTKNDTITGAVCSTDFNYTITIN